MRKSQKREQQYSRRKKLFSAMVMLLIAAILFTTASYAWLILSIAPEVTGITTSIGANGSLEIALLKTDTRADLTAIRTAVGESLSSGNASANNTWGNLLDLSFAEYGLSDILLMPARLNVIAAGNSYSVDTGMLSVPTYGYDGRIVDLTDNTISAIYADNAFSYSVGAQDYGVRAIGTTDSLSVQGSSLAMAKSNIATYTNSTKNAALSVMKNNGDTLFNIVIAHSMDADGTFGDTELDAMKSMLSDLQAALDYIELALRQGLVAVAASRIPNPDTFTAVKDRIQDPSIELTDLLSDLDEVGSVDQEFSNWISALYDAQNDLNLAKNDSNALGGGSYTWQEFRGILDYVMNLDYLYINGTLFSDFDTSTAGSLMGGNVELTLAPGSGIFAQIADFTDNFSSSLSYAGTNIEIATASNADPAYLAALAAAVKDLEAADSTGQEDMPAVDLTSTYGYALDLAFRCNASGSDLLLQTSGTQRVYDSSNSGSTLGGGSFMEFTSVDDSFTLEQRIKLMDAVRVAFLDDQNTILGVAKLNSSNRAITDGVLSAPLYLYDYSVSVEDGSMIMGERRKTDNVITALEQNVAKAITVIVWLDGDIVDNTMVSATEAASLSGKLNLQFASSADLVPAANGNLLNLTADKTALDELIERNKQTAEDGQLSYTNVSWEAFIGAYHYAVSVSDNASSGELQVYHAAVGLTKAADALEEVSQDAVRDKISEVRVLMGSVSGDVARHVVAGEDGNYIAVDEQEYAQLDPNIWATKGTVDSVDDSNNLHDEGNGIMTSVYTEESWYSLSSVLYQAEAAVMNPKAGDTQLNSVLTALEAAHKSLERQVYYKPYEHNGKLYYEAICDAANADTYGKWYDSAFKRVVEDVTILNLDAYADPVSIAQIVQQDYVRQYAIINPYIDLLDGLYSELRDEEMEKIRWDPFGYMFTEATWVEDAPYVTLTLGDATGTTTLGAVVLTKNGILFEVTKELTVYTPADGAQICNEVGEGLSSAILSVSESKTLTASLFYSTGIPEVGEQGTVYSWASTDTDAVTVSGTDLESCVITGKNVGTAYICLTVETREGNTYTCQFPVTVN